MRQPRRLNANQHVSHVRDTALANVDRFSYLGSVLENTLDLTYDVQRRVRLASAIFDELSHCVLLNRNIAVKAGARIAIYN